VSTETMPNPVEVLSPEHGPKRREEVTVATSGRSFGSTWYFAFFFISGFCSILYELIWLRLAMAEFGVTTAMVSIVISSFICTFVRPPAIRFCWSMPAAFCCRFLPSFACA